MLAHPLTNCGYAVTALAWDDRALPATSTWIDPQVLYAQLDERVSLDSWARLCSLVSAPDALVRWLEPFVDDALVIGYEMPEVMTDALQRLGRPYIDLVLHPLRFMPDLVFAMRTNVVAYHRGLERFRLPPAAIEQQAGLIRAKAAWMAPPQAMPPGTALVLGQVAHDRAMVGSDGRFASLADHVESLHALCAEHPLVLYKPHPYAGAHDPSHLAIGRLPAIELTRASFYHLIAQPEVELVAALNSSGLFEARFFGKQTRQFLPSLYDFDASSPPIDGKPGALVALTGAWMQPEFWRLVLGSGEGEVGAPTLPVAPPRSNQIRRSMNADWGYSFIEKVCA